VTPTTALADIRGYASAGRVILTRHARLRMVQRGASEDDVRHALTTATACIAAADGRWKVGGVDLEGDALTAVVAIDDGVVVVTVF
jgi:hypothetical protein